MSRKVILDGALFFGALTVGLLGTCALCAWEATALPAARAFYAVLAFAMFGAACLSADETYALAAGSKPITERTREAWHEYPRWFAPALWVSGLVLGRLVLPAPGDLRAWWLIPLVGFACAIGAHIWWGPPDTRADDEAP